MDGVCQKGLESHLRTAQNALEDKQKELRNLNELKCEKGILNRREVWLRFGLIERVRQMLCMVSPENCTEYFRG